MDEITKKINSAITLLKPELEESIKLAIKANTKDELAKLAIDLQNTIWDKIAVQIGQKFNLSAEIVKGLQQADDRLRELFGKVDLFTERTKDIDVHRTVVMSYAELQKEKKKSASIWSLVVGILSFVVGLLL